MPIGMNRGEAQVVKVGLAADHVRFTVHIIIVLATTGRTEERWTDSILAQCSAYGKAFLQVLGRNIVTCENPYLQDVIEIISDPMKLFDYCLISSSDKARSCWGLVGVT